MKTLHVVSLLLIISMISGCDSESLVSPEESSDLSLELLTEEMYRAENAAMKSESNVYTFATMEKVGSSNLTLRNNGVSFSIKSTQLIPGNAYTLWMAVFNNPEECGNDGCGAADLGNPDVQGDVLYSAGSLSGGTGKATFAGNRNAGDNSGSLFGPDAPGIIDTHKAEIHFVIRDHGPKIPGAIREQISTVGGGCDVNACNDVQFSVHLP